METEEVGGYTLMVGNPVDGVTLFGCFEEFDLAVEAGEREFQGTEWIVVPIHNV